MPGAAFRLAAMSWLGRLFGRGAVAPAGTPSVVIPEDLAAALTAGGMPLVEAVEVGLRAYLAAAPAATSADDERVPFWLARDPEHARDIEGKLLDRMAQRRAGEGGDGRQLELAPGPEVNGRSSAAGAKAARTRSSTSGGGPATTDD